MNIASLDLLDRKQLLNRVSAMDVSPEDRQRIVRRAGSLFPEDMTSAPQIR
jgi:hypothetical protein